MSTKSKSLHGHAFPSLSRASQVSVDPDTTASPSAETASLGNRAVATRSTRQPRLSFAAFAPSSDYDHPKKVKPEEENHPPEVPVSVEEEEEEEEEKRTWNLRPRKAAFASLKKETYGGGGGGGSEVKNQKVAEPKSNRQRGIPAESAGLGGGMEGNNSKENHRLWIALSRDEIEEDLFSMSGNRPSRRPRKRTKSLQKHLDVISPGLALVGMTADCFRLPTSPPKR